MGRVMSVRQPRVVGWWWIGCDDASALLPGINAASTGAFAFTDVDMNTWVATTLSIVDSYCPLNRRASLQREASD